MIIKFNIIISYKNILKSYIINYNNNNNIINNYKRNNKNILNNNNNNNNNNDDKFDNNNNNNNNSYLFTSDDDLISTRNKKGYNINIKRFIGFNFLALLLAFGANFFGVTSLLLSNINSDYFKTIKLDQIYSINNFLRFVTDDYMFIYPDDWIADFQVLDAKDRNLPILLQEKQKSRPSIAFKKQGTKLENVSVIKSKILQGFTLSGTLGTVNEAADKLLSLVAPPPKTYKLINAYEEIRNNQLYYIYEYSVQKPETDFNQHAISIITSRGTNLYTMTVVAPQSTWSKEESKILKIASSFQILNN